MEWTGLNELRERFLRYFESKGHVRQTSAPLVPQDDASLLLINSGMAPLKKYFLGLETPPGKRMTTCQKCIRTPDIERVGKTSRHGTFFEMLGNFSFGDYFKEEATEWAWEFITEDLKIPTDRLWVSIYENDEEAFSIWTKHRGVSVDRIVRLGREDNFWEIGSGPCGPCSEIYYDRGEQYACDNPDCAVGCDCDRYVEFWNLVFTQFNSDGQGNYTPLEHPNIDTGMGLERLACIMQGVDNLFEVDTIQNIMKHISRIAGVQYGEDEKTDISLRVATDHIRSTVFMVADGVVPQNEGRGYVLRRLLRRAARHGLLLGIKDPFLYEVCDTVIMENITAYPELSENASYIRKIIQVEEERFLKTVGQGIEMLNGIMDEVLQQQLKKGRPIISGDRAFRLYDTFGFPLDLTMEIAADRGLEVDEEGFLKFMQEQRERARKAREQLGGVSWEDDVLAAEDIDDRFVGYKDYQTSTTILQIVRDNELAGQINEGDEAVLILAETPFYAESGGQVGDTGIVNVGTSIFEVRDCRKSPTGHIMHIGKLISGFMSVGDSCTAGVNMERRYSIMRNHTAAHLLQAALRQVLGEHVHQAGSMVSDEMCRFDFTHFSATKPEQLAEIETRVNNMILHSLSVEAAEMPMDQAKQKGAIALFGDKYGDMVRVLSIGNVSVELCGGTHVANTAQLGLFKITGESSVAAGVRRIEAVTGRGVLALIDNSDRILQNVSDSLRVNSPLELEAKAKAISAQLKTLQKQVSDLNESLTGAKLNELVGDMTEIGPVRFFSASFQNMELDALKAGADRIRDQYPNAVGVVAVENDGKGSLMVFAGKDAVASGIHSGKLVKEIASIAGGGGGGRPDSAMGGMTDLSKVDEALSAAPACIGTQLQQSK